MSSKKIPNTFEARMERLQNIVTQMEKGEIALEKSVELYKEGVLLSQACREQLDKAKHEIQLYTEKGEEHFELSDTEPS